MTLEQLRARLGEVITELRGIHTEAGDAALTPEQSTRFDTLDTERQSVTSQIEREEQRARIVAELPAITRSEPTTQTVRTESGQFGANVIIKQDPFAVLEERSLTGRALERQFVESNLRAAEAVVRDGDQLGHFETLLKRHQRSTAWSANLLGRARTEYADAFGKLMSGRPELLSNEERTALSVGTNANGGYLLPTFLDPTVLLTNSGSSNVMRQYATVKTLVDGKTWNGVTSAGVTASWDAELEEVSDDSPTFGTVSITPTKPQAFVQASFEAFEDIAGLQGDILMLFGDARDRLEGTAHLTGLGSSNQPKGLFTAINASATLKITSTTAATIGEVDLTALIEALPIRWRRNGQFVMAPVYAHAIKRLGTAVSSTFSGDLTQSTASRILGYGVVESDDAPTTQTTTALDQEIVFADLSQYTIVDKPGGTSIEFVPILMGSNSRPSGGRGYLMHWRTGADLPVLNAGRVLCDKTSA